MSVITVRFIQEACTPQTGNSRYKAGDLYDVRSDWAAVLIAQGLAVDINAVAEVEPEPLPDLESMTMPQLRKLAAGYSAKLAPKKADLIANILDAMKQ
jgi:hypothetical protein